MRTLLPKLVLLAGWVSLPAAAQMSHHAICEGTFMNVPAVVEGDVVFTLTQQHFSGVLRMPNETAQFVYGDYKALMPFQGMLSNARGQWMVSVLDSGLLPGTNMTIYDGTPTLRAPDTLGYFICR